MFALKHIRKSYKNEIVLDDVSLSVNPGEVIALIGENGAGKTTLLKIIAGLFEPDLGVVELHHEEFGYVPQEIQLAGTIRDAFGPDVEDWRTEYSLSMVGLDKLPLNRSIEALSGGQKTRLSLAMVLASNSEPTVLLLDEPTNNLDTEGLIWLKSFIKGFRGAVILVSHDRQFINDVATHVAELHKGCLKLYSGNYDFYKQQKELEYQAQLSAYERNEQERKRLEKAMQAHSEKSQHAHKHIKRSDNDKSQRDYFKNRVTVKLGQNARMLRGRLERLDDEEKPESYNNYKVALYGSVPSHKLIVKCEDVKKSFGAKDISYPNLVLQGSERLHIRGVNGSGKSTLLKLIADILSSDGGTIKWGAGINFGYFSQDVSGLNDDVSSLENLVLTGAHMTHIHRELKSLGFDESDLRKRPKELSRGQQAKLSFAKLLLSNNHILILDEPTNHLDLPTREKIESALQRYQGALLVASHDEYFVRSINPTKTIKLTERNNV